MTHLEIILSVFLLISVILLLKIFYTIKQNTTVYSGNTNQAKEFTQEKGNIDDLLSSITDNDYFKTKMNLSFKEGFEAGCKATMNQFVIEIEEIIEIEDSWFKRKCTIGYSKQLLYNGVPMGKPEFIIKYKHEKVKKEEVEKLIKEVKGIIENTIELYKGRGFKIINKKAV